MVPVEGCSQVRIKLRACQRRELKPHLIRSPVRVGWPVRELSRREQNLTSPKSGRLPRSAACQRILQEGAKTSPHIGRVPGIGVS